jgi:hypothetical protein
MQRLEVFCDMALQLRRDASRRDFERVRGVFRALGRDGQNPPFVSRGPRDHFMPDSEMMELLSVAVHGTPCHKCGHEASDGGPVSGRPLCDRHAKEQMSYPEMERVARNLFLDTADSHGVKALGYLLESGQRVVLPGQDAVLTGGKVE